jgi:hypothetical protein
LGNAPPRTGAVQLRRDWPPRAGVTWHIARTPRQARARPRGRWTTGPCSCHCAAHESRPSSAATRSTAGPSFTSSPTARTGTPPGRWPSTSNNTRRPASIVFRQEQAATSLASERTERGRGNGTPARSVSATMPCPSLTLQVGGLCPEIGSLSLPSATDRTRRAVRENRLRRSAGLRRYLQHVWFFLDRGALSAQDNWILGEEASCAEARKQPTGAGLNRPGRSKASDRHRVPRMPAPVGFSR